MRCKRFLIRALFAIAAHRLPSI